VTTQSLSPRGAVLLGLLCIGVAAVPILSGLHLTPVKPTPGTPAWIALAVGLMFLFAGVTLLADAAAGGIWSKRRAAAKRAAGIPPGAVHPRSGNCHRHGGGLQLGRIRTW
jgi:hypothetical protein